MKSHSPTDKNPMYSQAGKQSINIYALLQYKNEIIKPQESKPVDPKLRKEQLINQQYRKEKEKVITKYVDQYYQKMQEANIANIQDIDQKQELPKDILKTIVLKQSQQPFGKLTSRIPLTGSQNRDNSSFASVGSYKPKYHLVEKKCLFNEKELQNLSERQVRSSSERFVLKTPDIIQPKQILTHRLQRSVSQRDSINMNSPNSALINGSMGISQVKDILNTYRVKGFVDLQRQIPRNEQKSTLNDNLKSKLFEQLFVQNDLPLIYSKVNRQKNSDFGSQQGRNSVENIVQIGLQYDVNFDAVKPRVKSIPNFKKVEGRKIKIKIVAPSSTDYSCVNENNYLKGGLNFCRQKGRRFEFQNQLKQLKGTT